MMCTPISLVNVHVPVLKNVARAQKPPSAVSVNARVPVEALSAPRVKEKYSGQSGKPPEI